MAVGPAGVPLPVSVPTASPGPRTRVDDDVRGAGLDHWRQRVDVAAASAGQGLLREAALPDEEAGATNTPATGAPTISGTAQVGETLSASTSDIADADGLDNPSYSYQWIRGSSDIEGATGSSYTCWTPTRASGSRSG